MRPCFIVFLPSFGPDSFSMETIISKQENIFMGYNRDMQAYSSAHRNMVIKNDTISDELYQK